MRVLIGLSLLVVLMACSLASPTAPSPPEAPPVVITTPPPEVPVDVSPVAPAPPPVADETLYWSVVAPGCRVRAGVPNVAALELRRDTVSGNERTLVYYDPAPDWFIDARFLRVDGKWLLCFWDTRG